MKTLFDKAEIAQSIVARFERQVERFPDRIAVSDARQSMNFDEVNRAANRIAAEIMNRRGTGEEAVAVLLEHGPLAITTLLAVLKAGKYYVPLDPLYPGEAIRHMLRDSGASLILADNVTLALVRELAQGKIEVFNTDTATGSAFDRNPDLPIQPESLACLLYTSGSTGLPKGIRHSHRTLMHHIWSHSKTFSLCSDDRQALLLSYSFAASVSEIYGALLNGASLSLNDVRKTGLENLASWLIDEHITAFKLPVSLFRLFLGMLKGGMVFPDIRLVVLGGDTLFRKDVDLFRRHFPADGMLVNRLASTETFTITRFIIDQTTVLTDQVVPIGYPDDDKDVFIRDDDDRPVENGDIGEIVVGSRYVSPGYWRLPEEDKARYRFHQGGEGRSLYYTGDLGRMGADGCLEHFGRKDSQVKIRGYRVGLSSVEAALNALDQVKEAAVAVHEAENQIGGKKLVAYLVPVKGSRLSVSGLRNALMQAMPHYMIPSLFVMMDKLPMTSSGKVDRLSLPPPGENRPLLDSAYIAPRTPTEKKLEGIWSEALGLKQVGAMDNFFDLGGDSLTLLAVHVHLQEAFAIDIPVVVLFRFPSIMALARFIVSRQGVHQEGNTASRADRRPSTAIDGDQEKRVEDAGSVGRSQRDDIAVVGMAGTFPGAQGLDEFWENIKNGVMSVRHYSTEELRDAGIAPDLLDHPDYVKAGAMIDGIELFDAGFFGFTPLEAMILDPQHRVFLETAWHALEHAGYVPETFKGRIGIFAGASPSVYLHQIILPRRQTITGVTDIRLKLSNDPEFLATRVAYKLNLTGPALNIATACSTSLVAVHLACRSLLSGECELALAGGVAVETPQKSGYLYQDGWFCSPDGQCRPFDDDARGTVVGNGVGLVLLKRLTDAMTDGDTIHALIKGSAVNNDGSFKIGFAAPSVDGQATVIEEAQRNAGVSPEFISYVEAHGTGTALGDPVEIAALTQAFRRSTMKTGFCAIGSVKSNIGHASRAAGVAGLIKTIMALKSRQIPPSLNFNRPNREIDFQASPFFVASSLQPWTTEDDRPRRAGVSSFGVGGTNAHVIVEEWIENRIFQETTPWQLLVLSARTEAGLETVTANLLDHLRRNGDEELADVAFTLQSGRRTFGYRRMVVCRDRKHAVTLLESPKKTGRLVVGKPGIVFMFPGEGPPYAGMAFDLYHQEPLFSATVDYCAGILKPLLGLDVRNVLFPGKGDRKQAVMHLKKETIAQAALFVAEYAMARLLIEWGIYPEAMIGQGVGEFSAICLAGVLTLEDALPLLARRDDAGVECTVSLQPPHIPVISGVLGTWLTPEEAMDPCYCHRLLRDEFRIEEGLKTLATQAQSVLLEVGPGCVLGKHAGRLGELEGTATIPTIKSWKERGSDREVLLRALGQMWLLGVEIDWLRVHDRKRQRRIPLPLYPFEKKRYWVEKAGIA